MSKEQATDAKQIKDLQGYGEVLKVFAGKDAEGNNDIRSYHIAPVPIKKLGELVECLSKFQEAAERASKGGGIFTPEDVENGAKMVQLGLERTQPDITIKEIEEVFDLGTLIQASRYLIGVNQLQIAGLDAEGNPVPLKGRRNPQIE
jgi:hypothetical protein